MTPSATACSIGVLHDEVLVEEAEGLLGRRGGEADERGVEVFQHLTPEVVDGAVALVGDDEVEGLDGDGGVVGDGFGRALEHCRAMAPESSSSSGSQSPRL